MRVLYRETERGGPCRPIETSVNRDSGSTYDRVSFLGYLPKTGGVIGSLPSDNFVKSIQIIVIFFAGTVIKDMNEGFDI